MDMLEFVALLLIQVAYNFVWFLKTEQKQCSFSDKIKL